VAIPNRDGEPSAAVAVRGLRKSFGPNVVLDDIDLELFPGDSVVLVGENGAGKSTLAKIVAGVHRQDDGELLMQGLPVSFRSPRDALRAGIAFIPQELSYVPLLTAAENVLLNAWPSRRGFVSQGAVLRRAKEAIQSFGIEFDLDRPMIALTIGERQIVEIVKALVREAQVLVLDEPTASLSEGEAGVLFSTFRSLQNRGVALLSVLHRLDQVEAIGDRVVVLRNGRCTLSARVRDVDRNQVVQAMLGTEVRRVEARVARSHTEAVGDVALSADGLITRGEPGLRGLSFQLRKNTVLGLFGPRGAGTELLMPLLAGEIKPAGGAFAVNGETFSRFRNPGQVRKLGISVVPPERKAQGLMLEMPVSSNVVMGAMRRVSRWGFLRAEAEQSLAKEVIELMDVRLRSAAQPVGELSGGNQQKVLLASRLITQPSILVLDQPTRGVDVGARAQIHAHLRRLADAGMAILILTNDVEEAVIVSDRLLVLSKGVVCADLVGPQITQERALQAVSE
jgi:ABC-type sugar transport system ATPase subunit